MLTVSCPACGQKLKFHEDALGKKARCGRPECAKVFVVSRESDAEEDAVYGFSDDAPMAQFAAPPKPAPTYFVRRAKLVNLVSGPFSIEKLHHFAAKGQLVAKDMLSTDQENWKSAGALFPAFFEKAATNARICQACQNKLLPNETRCPKCQTRGVQKANPTADDADDILAMADVAETNDPTARLFAQSMVKRPRRKLEADGAILEFGVGKAGIVAVTENGWIGWWDSANGKLLKEWTCPKSIGAKVAVAAEAGKAVIALETKTGLLGMGRQTELFAVNLGEDEVEAFETIPGTLLTLSMNARGTEIAAVDAKSQVIFWNSKGNDRPADLVIPGKVYGFHLDRNLLAVGDVKGRVALWNIAKGKKAFDLTKGSDQKPACTDVPHEFSFSAAGDRLLTSSGKLVFNESKNQGMTGAMVGGLAGAIVGGITESLGEAKAIAQREKTTSMRCWDLVERSLISDWLALLTDHPESIAGSELSPDGQRAITLGWEDCVRAWSLRRRHYSGRVFLVEKEVSEKKRAALAEKHVWTNLLRLIRRTAFTGDGLDVVVHLSHDDELHVIPWPKDVE